MKFLEDDDPDTKHLYVINGGGGAHLEYALPRRFATGSPYLVDLHMGMNLTEVQDEMEMR